MAPAASASPMSLDWSGFDSPFQTAEAEGEAEWGTLAPGPVAEQQAAPASPAPVRTFDARNAGDWLRRVDAAVRTRFGLTGAGLAGRVRFVDRAGFAASFPARYIEELLVREFFVPTFVMAGTSLNSILRHHHQSDWLENLRDDKALQRRRTQLGAFVRERVRAGNFIYDKTFGEKTITPRELIADVIGGFTTSEAFTAFAQLVRDAREHGVEIRPVCINASRWDCTLEPLDPPLDFEGRGTARSVVEGLRAKRAPFAEEEKGRFAPPLHQPAAGPQRRGDRAPGTIWDCRGQSHPALLQKQGRNLLPLRLGLRMVRGLANEHAALDRGGPAMEAPFASIEDVWRRAGVPPAALEKLADADAFASLGSPVQALWRVRGLGEAPLPLFAAADDRTNEPAKWRCGDDRRARGGRGLRARSASRFAPTRSLS
jgi:hypothetical protein